MTIMLSDKGDHWVVSTLSASGKRRKLPRRLVRVPEGDLVLLAAEIQRQEQRAQDEALVTNPPQKLVD